LYQRKTNITNKVWLFSGLGMIGLAFFKHCLAFYCIWQPYWIVNAVKRYTVLTVLLISAARPTRHGELTYKTK